MHTVSMYHGQIETMMENTKYEEWNAGILREKNI